MEQNVEIAGGSRAKRKEEKDGTLPQKWQIQNAQQSVYPYNKLHTFSMLWRLPPSNGFHKCQSATLAPPSQKKTDPFSSQMAVN